GGSDLWAPPAPGRIGGLDRGTEGCAQWIFLFADDLGVRAVRSGQSSKFKIQSPEGGWCRVERRKSRAEDRAPRGPRIDFIKSAFDVRRSILDLLLRVIARLLRAWADDQADAGYSSVPAAAAGPLAAAADVERGRSKCPVFSFQCPVASK